MASVGKNATFPRVSPGSSAALVFWMAVVSGLMLAPARQVAAAPQAPVQVGVTTQDGVNLRGGPGTNFAVLAKLPISTVLEVLGQEAGWYRVATAKATVGWVVADFLSLRSGQAQPAVARAIMGNVIEEGLNLRARPGTGQASLGKLSADTVVEILTQEAGWYRVRTPRGTIGWVSAEFVALDVAPGGAPDNAGTNDIVRIAQQYHGYPYIWGGAGPRGFDCSGFTQYVYRQAGVRLPRTANQQFSMRNWRRVSSISALVPGDLVYFERTTEESGITHAGIYVGEGRMIAARSERLGVRYVSMYEPFWNSRFVGGMRPFR